MVESQILPLAFSWESDYYFNLLTLIDKFIPFKIPFSSIDSNLLNGTDNPLTNVYDYNPYGCGLESRQFHLL